MMRVDSKRERNRATDEVRMYNFSGFLDDNYARSPDKVVISFGDREITNRELYGRVNELAAGMLELGLKRGDIVAFLLNNTPECLETILAVNRIGAIVLPLNARLSPEEWVYILHHSGAVGLITESLFQGAIENITDRLPDLAIKLLLTSEARTGWFPYEAVIARHKGARVRLASMAHDDIHRLMYTSGTTSHPKGVPLSHGNMMAKTHSHLLEFWISSEDCTLVCGPLYHVGGLDIPALTTFYAGGSLVIMPKFDPVEFVRIVETQRPSSCWLATAMLNLILKLPGIEDRNLNSLRYVIFGGEKTPRSLIEACVRVFPRTWMSDGYGSTETSSGDIFNDADHVLSKVGSVGRPVRNLEMRLLDDNGKDVPQGQRGELALRGAKVFKGYWKDPEATAKAFIGDWYLTGDVGYLDEDGYLFLEDRKKDIIISGGENISCSEIERVLYEFPNVMEAAVVAGPHDRWGEVPVAYIVCQSGQRIAPDSLREFCLAKLARFKAPQIYRFVEALPRTSSGKVRKTLLREWERDKNQDAD